MALYTPNELKSKLSNGKARELVMEKNKQKRLWIPELKIFYRRSHFALNQIPGINTNYKGCGCPDALGEKNKKCRICKYIDTLWEKWRASKDQKTKEKIQAQINRHIAENFYVNAIDIDDPDLKFQAVKFTQARIQEIITVDESNDISTIIWLYKKIVKKDKSGKDRTSYSLAELIEDSKALELKERISELTERSYNEGGLVDLEKAYGLNMSLKKFNEMLTKGGRSSEEEEVDEDIDMLGDSEESEEVIEDDENLSIDDLDDDDLDELDDNPDDEVVKKLPLTAKFIKENKNNRNLLLPIFEYLFEQNLIKLTENYAKDLKKVFSYVKEHKVEIPENLIEGEEVAF